MATYKVLLNKSGEVHTFFTTSVSKEKAVRNCVKRLEARLDLRSGSLRGYFSGSKDNVKVEELMRTIFIKGR